MALVLAVLVTCAAYAQDPPPLPGGQDALQLGLSAVESHAGRGDSTVGGPAFDPGTREWRMTIGRDSTATPRRFFVSINEASGLVCVHEPPASHCMVRDDAAAALQGARDKRRGLAEAAVDPPPDLQGVLVAVIRHQLDTGGYLASNPMPVYVSIQSPGDATSVDMSPEAIRSLGDTGLLFHPGSAWTVPQGGERVGTTMRMGVGVPTRRPDGDYEVTFGFWCGRLCASSHVAVLRREGSTWRVISSEMRSIS